jgi:hypothetical protein
MGRGGTAAVSNREHWIDSGGVHVLPAKELLLSWRGIEGWRDSAQRKALTGPTGPNFCIRAPGTAHPGGDVKIHPTESSFAAGWKGGRSRPARYS